MEMDNLPSNASSCVVRVNPDAKSYVDFMSQYENERFPGKVRDSALQPLPDVLGFVLVPQSWIDESEENLDFFVKNGINPYYSHRLAVASQFFFSVSA